MAIDTRQPPGTLYTRTRALLRADRRALFEIATESGLPFYWLRKVHSGEINDPGVNRIQRLYEFLTASNIQLK
jgi:hypothetical protein